MLAACAVGYVLACDATPARAGGFDTPTLYTARHMGMGGTAIGYVDDASAAFHNPAGLQHVQGFAALADFSLLLGHVQGSPDPSPEARGLTSALTVAPFFLAGAAYRMHPWISLGVAIFPVASGAGEYTYDNLAGNATHDETRLVFFEGTPVLSIDVPEDAWLPGKLSFGVGYRIDAVDFTRSKGPPGNPAVIDLELSGWSFRGVRVGIQWQPTRDFSFGAVFRSRIDVKTDADRGRALGQTVEDPELTFVLPSKLGFGARYDHAALGVALDLEYGLYSENGRAPLRGRIGGRSGEVSNVSRWHDAPTLRAGAEYRAGTRQAWALRLGYVFDAQVSNERFPTAFGTPPVATHSFTGGVGYAFDAYRVDLAYAYRFGATDVQASELAPAAQCRFCGSAGRYAIRTHGLYVDVSGDWAL
jgi:long-subunit fatty acid transport protein